MPCPTPSPSPSTQTPLLLLSPFLHHTLLSLPATLQFLLLPSRQLGRPTPHAHAVVRQYALLLFCSGCISLAFALRQLERQREPAAAAVSLHSGPGGSSAIGGPPAMASLRFSAEDALEAQVALALGLYHLGPVVRSGRRVWEWLRSVGGGGKRWGRREGEALVYVVAHVVVGGRLVAEGWWFVLGWWTS